MQKDLFEKFEASDFIALVVILGIFILKAINRDGTTDSILASVIFYYFGKKIPALNKN